MPQLQPQGSATAQTWGTGPSHKSLLSITSMRHDGASLAVLEVFLGVFLSQLVLTLSTTPSTTMCDLDFYISCYKAKLSTPTFTPTQRVQVSHCGS